MPAEHPTASSRFAKRALDIVGATAGLVVAALPMAVIAFLVRRNLGSPVLFRQARPGRDGEIFTLVKFRTMRSGEGSDADRITPFGQALRSTSLDELPELWNVLKGDMSLVGPRPLLVAYLERYTAHQARRHEVRPGLTGIAQISGRNLVGWDDRFDLDVEYVDTWTVGGDLQIIWRTVRAVLTRDGVSDADHTTMHEFTGSTRGDATP